MNFKVMYNPKLNSDGGIFIKEYDTYEEARLVLDTLREYSDFLQRNQLIPQAIHLGSILHKNQDGIWLILK